MASNTIKGLTVEIGGDTTKLGKALDAVEKKSRDLSSELGQINKLLKLDPGNTDLLAQKQEVLADAIKSTSQKLKTLKEAERQVQKQFERGEASEEQVRALKREIIAAEKKLNGYEKAAEETADAIKKAGKSSKDLADDTKKAKKGADQASDSLDDLAKSADKAEKASDGLGSKLKGVVAGGAKALAAGVTALTGALVASAEASREYRREMGKLDTAFTTAGHSSEAALKTYKSLQGVLGETDQAVEAANHLAKLTDNEEDLQKWTDICTGVYATFGASLPIEGLTEAANETAKVGAVTGPLADALNWAGVSEDKFNESLAACNSEQERQKLIMETLGGLYDEAAEKYKETNAEVIRANEANEEWAASLAEVGEGIEPLLSDIKLLGASLVKELVPGVKEVAGAFRGMLNGDEGAAANLGEAISGIFSNLLNKIIELAPAVVEVGMSLITTLTTSLLHSLPDIARTLIDVAVQAVNALAAYLPALLPAIQNAAVNLVSQLVNSVPAIVGALSAVVDGLVVSLPTLLQTLFEQLPIIITNLLTTALPALLTLLHEKLPELLTSLIDMLITYLPMATEMLTGLLISIVDQLVPQAVSLLTETLPTLIETLTTGLANFAPVLLESFVSLLGTVMDAVPVVIEALIPVLPSLINTVLDALNEAMPVLLDVAIELLFMILDAIPVLLDALIPALPVIIDTIIGAVIKAMPVLLDAAVTLLLAIVQAIPKILGPLTQQLPTIISTIVGSLLRNLPLLINAAIKLFFGILAAIPKVIAELGRQIPSIIKAIVSGLGKGLGSIKQIGKDLIKGLWNGIKDMTGWITGKLEGFGDSVLSGIKSFFGIESPSRVFRDEVGKMLAVGLAEGIEDNANEPIDALSSLSNDLLGEAEELNGLTLERRLNNTFAAPETASAVETVVLTRLDSILAAIERGQIITIDGDALVGATANRMDNALGQRRVLAARGAI